MLTRRMFLQGLGAATTMYLVPRKAYAQSTEPLYITIEARGGWDPTILMDPKSGPQFTTFFDAQDIVTLGELSFAPRAGGASPVFYECGPDGDRQSFFHKYADQLLVLNGVDTQTNSHDIGPRHTFSGNSRDDAPAFSALIAAVREADIGAQLPLGFVATGGFVESRGLLPTSQTGNIGPVLDLAHFNFHDTYNEVPDNPIIHPSAMDRIRLAEADRLARKQSGGLLPRTRWAMEKLAGARAVEAAFAPLTAELSNLPALTPGEEANYTIEQAQLVMASMAAGVCAAANIDSGGFDTHDENHDADHPTNAQRLFEVIDYVWRTAVTLGIDDRLTIMVGSDFSRTVYNGDGGKDHWPITSMMLMGAGVAGGRVIGSTGDNVDENGEEVDGHVGNLVRLQGDQLVAAAPDDPEGFLMRPGHVHQCLRAHAGISNHPHAVRFPLNDIPASPLPLLG